MLTPPQTSLLMTGLFIPSQDDEIQDFINSISEENPNKFLSKRDIRKALVDRKNIKKLFDWSINSGQV